METVTSLLSKYRGGSPTAYYQKMLELALEFVNYERRNGLSISFICHRLSGDTMADRIGNFYSLADTLINLSVFTTTVGFNQLYFHADVNPDDPRLWELKFGVFYNGLVEACDQVIAVPGYEAAIGCNVEIAHARKIGKPVYLLNYEPPQRDRHWLENFANEESFGRAANLGWARAAPDSNINIPVEERTPWQTLVSPLD